MKTYEIEQTATAVILWTGEARDEKHALDQMAQSAGYRNHADACHILYGDADAAQSVHGCDVREVAPIAGETGARLAADQGKAEERSMVGAFLSARQMALKPHDLSKDGMDATAKDGGLWKWSNHLNVWACVAVSGEI